MLPEIAALMFGSNGTYKFQAFLGNAIIAGIILELAVDARRWHGAS